MGYLRVFLCHGIDEMNSLPVFWWGFYVFAVKRLMKTYISTLMMGFKLLYERETNITKLSRY